MWSQLLHIVYRFCPVYLLQYLKCPLVYLLFIYLTRSMFLILHYQHTVLQKISILVGIKRKLQKSKHFILFILSVFLENSFSPLLQFTFSQIISPLHKFIPAHKSLWFRNSIFHVYQLTLIQNMSFAVNDLHFFGYKIVLFIL